MKLPFDPRQLDERIVPTAARRLREFVDRAGDARRRGTGVARRTAVGVRAALSRSARRLDERYAATGPLAAVRNVPQVALLLVAAVFVSGAFAAAWLTEPAPSPGARPTTADGLLRQAQLGVLAGANVEEQLNAARAVVDELAERRPDARYLALVSLDDYVPVAALETLVDQTDPQRVYLRAPGIQNAETVEVPLAGDGAQGILPVLCTATASRKRADAEQLRALAATVAAGTPEQEVQRADFENEAARSDDEAAAYEGDCRTVFAVVVEAEAVVLRALLDREGVRGVEAAPVGITVLDVTVTPLFPEVSGTVPTGTER